MLEDYARRNGFHNPTHFTDDGISGTRFDRPGFTAMMEEVEAENVEAIIIKDMSRLGRDYLKVGQVMEILRQRGVRLIAINDGVDSANGENDFTPFLNIMYEFYARDTSRKIKSVFKAKGMSGKHLTGTVIYGYLWDEKREHWIVDEEAADVVRRIFAMTLDGYGPYQIANRLSQEKIEIPSLHLSHYGEGVNQSKTFKDPYGWGSSTIVNILKKREYLGHTINFKTRKHFKDKKSHYVDENEWAEFIKAVQETQAERRIKVLDEYLSIWEKYERNKGTRHQFDKMKPGKKKEQFEQKHSAELALYEAAVRYLEKLKTTGEEVTPKKWQAEADRLKAEKSVQYQKMKSMREDIKAVENLKKTAEQLARTENEPARKKEEQEL